MDLGQHSPSSAPAPAGSPQAAARQATAAPPADLAAWLESGPLCQAIVESIQQGVVVCDRELRYRLWNPFMERITGQAAGDVLGKRAPEVHAFLKEQGIDVLMERALAGHGGSIADFAHAQKRTNWAGYLSGSVTPLRAADGRITGVIGLFLDSTRRKRLEEGFAAQERRYRQLFDENPQPMWVHDVETLAFLAVNEAAIRHYGYSREEFLFMTMNDILAPADLLPSKRGEAGLRGSVDEARLWRHRTKSGQILEVEINSQVVSFADRRAVLVLANDVTERRKTVQSLRESELKHRTLIETADVAIFLSDAATGQILNANRRAEVLLGLPPHQITGLRLEDLQPPELAAPRHESPPGATPPVPAAKPQQYVRHRAGRRIPVDILSSVIEVGGQKMVQSIYRDVTERHRAEEELAHRSRQLETLARGYRQINAVLETGVILRNLVRAALDLLQAGGGMAGLLTEGRVAFSEYQTRQGVSRVDFTFAPGQGVAGYVVATKLSYCSNDPARDPLVVPEVQQTLRLHNLVAVPIHSRAGQVRGCLEIHNTQVHQLVEPEDLTLLELLAAGAAEAMENADLFEARRRAEARYRRLADNLTDMLWTVDLELRFTDVTPSASLLLGYQPEELIGRSIFDVLTPASAAATRKAAEQGLKRDRLSQKGTDWSRVVEIEQLRKDGSTAWTEARVRMLLDDAGQPAGFVGSTRDISERRKAQAELQRLVAAHAATLESVPDGILVVDNTGRMVGFNQKFVHMWRVPKAVMESGQDDRALEAVLAQLKDPEDFLAKVKSLYASSAESHDRIEFKDGRVFERFSSPQRVAGEIAGRVWAFRDISPTPPSRGHGPARGGPRRKPN